MKNPYMYQYVKNYLEPLTFGGVDLLQIGTSHCAPNTKIKKHPHINFYELTVITAGWGSVTTNNLSMPVSQNDIYVSFPFDQHAISAASDSPMNYDHCAFFLNDPDLSAELQRLSVLHSNPKKRVIQNDRLKDLVAMAIYETSTRRPFQSLYLETLFKQIVIELIRSFTKQSTATLAPGKKEELCYQIIGYINTHIYSINSLQKISDELHYNYTYLSKVFTQTTSQTISDYYHFQRLETACMLIRQNKLNFTQISEKLNYSSLYAFSKAFKGKYAISPMAYKKLYLQSFLQAETNKTE